MRDGQYLQLSTGVTFAGKVCWLDPNEAKTVVYTSYCVTNSGTQPWLVKQLYKQYTPFMY